MSASGEARVSIFPQELARMKPSICVYSWLDDVVTSTISVELMDETFTGGADERDELPCRRLCDSCGVVLPNRDVEWQSLSCKHAQWVRAKLGGFGEEGGIWVDHFLR